MPGRATALPDAVIGLVPLPGKMLQHRAFQFPAGVIHLELGHTPLMKGVDQFAIDIELKLRMRGVADPHRLRALVAGQPCGLPFQKSALAHDAVHDLHVGRRAGRGAEQPIVPGGSFRGIAGVHQRQQREGGIPQPAEAIIPVARAAELFGQRGRRCRDDAAGRRIGLRLQRDQRAHDQIAMLALIGAMAAPFGPELLGVAQLRVRGRSAWAAGRCEGP